MIVGMPEFLPPSCESWLRRRLSAVQAALLAKYSALRTVWYSGGAPIPS